MTDDELVEILKKFETTRVEKLNDNSKRLFYAIMKIADERDELKKENQRLKERIHDLLKENTEWKLENQRLNNVLNELEKIIQTDTEIYCCSESAMKSFKSAETIYKSYLLNKLKKLKESDK